MNTNFLFCALLNLYIVSGGCRDAHKQVVVCLQKLKLTYIFSKDDTCQTCGL